MSSGKITLSNASGSQKVVEKTDENIPVGQKYMTASVEDGSWIIYNTEGSDAVNYPYKLMLTSGEMYDQLKKPITSVRLIDYVDPGICIFGDNHYRGTFKTYTPQKNDSVDVASEFPVGTNGGVSSMIMFGSSSWKLHYKNSSGTHETTVAPGRYDSMLKIPGGLVKDDQIFAVERVN